MYEILETMYDITYMFLIIITLIVRPTISLEILNYTHFIDDTTTLPCPVSSNPSSTIEWRMGVNMTKLQGSQNDSSGNLTIRHLKIADSNTYYCIATNYLGSDIAATTVIVEGTYIIISNNYQ